jgi:hypothetical protein
MKKIAVILGALAVIAALSCDPLGTEDTKIWVTGQVFTTDSLGDDQGMPGVIVYLDLKPDTFQISSSNAVTDSSGRFWMEIQVYPDLPEEGTTGYTMPPFIYFGLIANYDEWFYVYATWDNPFVVDLGDTLQVWPVWYP